MVKLYFEHILVLASKGILAIMFRSGPEPFPWVEVLDAGTSVWRRTWMRWTYGPCGAWPPAMWLESSVLCKSDTPTKIKVVLHRWIFLAVWRQRLGVLPNFTHLRAKLRNIAYQVTQVTCCHTWGPSRKGQSTRKASWQNCDAEKPVFESTWLTCRIKTSRHSQKPVKGPFLHSCSACLHIAA